MNALRRLTFFFPLAVSLQEVTSVLRLLRGFGTYKASSDLLASERLTPNFTVMATSTPGSISLEGINNEKRGEKFRWAECSCHDDDYFNKSNTCRDVCHCIHKCRYKNPLIIQLFYPVIRTHTPAKLKLYR